MRIVRDEVSLLGRFGFCSARCDEGGVEMSSTYLLYSQKLFICLFGKDVHGFHTHTDYEKPAGGITKPTSKKTKASWGKCRRSGRRLMPNWWRRLCRVILARFEKGVVCWKKK